MMYMVTLYKADIKSPDVQSFEVYAKGATGSGAMLRARELLHSLVALPPGIDDVWWCAWQVPGVVREGLRNSRRRKTFKADSNRLDLSP